MRCLIEAVSVTRMPHEKQTGDIHKQIRSKKLLSHLTSGIHSKSFWKRQCGYQENNNGWVDETAKE